MTYSILSDFNISNSNRTERPPFLINSVHQTSEIASVLVNKITDDVLGFVCNSSIVFTTVKYSSDPDAYYLSDISRCIYYLLVLYYLLFIIYLFFKFFIYFLFYFFQYYLFFIVNNYFVLK